MDVSFSPNNQFLASASVDKTVKIWTRRDWTLIHTLKEHLDWVVKIDFSSDGQFLASASDDSTVKLWRVSDGELIHNLQGHTNKVYGVSFSPNTLILASAGEDRRVILWRFDHQLSKILTDHDDVIKKMTVSSDGHTVEDGTIKLWQVSDGKLLQSLKGHQGKVMSVSFSPDGQLLASSGEDATVKLWGISDGKLLSTLRGHRSHVRNVVFIDPQTLASVSAGRDKTVIFWSLKDLTLDVLLKHGCNWVQNHLKYNPNVEESDRHVCDEIEFKR